ncbi:MAG: cytochrome c oxidase subunit 3 family protein [Marinobacter sp.]|uniref:cytochrome c oxidase subunit 3 family protein n=1 Tax=Marinobacter sp. TaxID=50741 RepID=UPI00396E6F68
MSLNGKIPAWSLNRIVVMITEHSITDNIRESGREDLPGDFAMWLFILMELTVFAIFFISFATMQSLYPVIFGTGKSSLHPVAGLICTLALITSSYFVALAGIRLQQGNKSRCSLFLAAALMAATVYLITKFWEYSQLIQAGYDLSTNTFYTLYFFITFFHLMHVVLGMVILGYMLHRTLQGAYATGEHSGFESGGSYWHMVDLVWIILFPTIYVIH